jgi:hypothetical protein
MLQASTEFMLRAFDQEARMATFDQRDQKVTYQYNADVINLTNISNRAELAREIENISAEVERAGTLNAIEPSDALKAKTSLRAAAEEAKAATPNKSKILSMMENASDIVKGVKALADLYNAIRKAIELVATLF